MAEMSDLALFTRTIEELKTMIEALGGRYTQSQEHLVKSILDAFGGRLDLVINKVDTIASAASGMVDLQGVAKKLADNLDKLDKVMPKTEQEKHFAAIHEAVEQLGDAADLKAILETVEDALQQTRQLVADVQGALVAPAGAPTVAASVKTPIVAVTGVVGGILVTLALVAFGPGAITRSLVQNQLTLEERWGPTLINKAEGMDCVTRAFTARTAATCQVKVPAPGVTK